MRSLDIAVSLADKISPRKPSIAKNQSPSSTEPATDKNKESKSSSSESIQHMQAGQILAKEFDYQEIKFLRLLMVIVKMVFLHCKTVSFIL